MTRDIYMCDNMTEEEFAEFDRMVEHGTGQWMMDRNGDYMYVPGDSE